MELLHRAQPSSHFRSGADINNALGNPGSALFYVRRIAYSSFLVVCCDTTNKDEIRIQYDSSRHYNQTKTLAGIDCNWFTHIL